MVCVWVFVSLLCVIFSQCYCIHWCSFSSSSFAIASMVAHRTDYGKVVKFGTLIKDILNTNHSKFGVSNSNSLAPPLVQSFTHVYANNF